MQRPFLIKYQISSKFSEFSNKKKKKEKKKKRLCHTSEGLFAAVNTEIKVT